MFLPTILLALLTLLTHLTHASPVDLAPHTTTPTFRLTITNACPTPRTFGLYRVDQPTTAPWTITPHSPPVPLLPGQSQTFLVPYALTGMRLSGHAEWPVAAQWNPQALFEFGFSTFQVNGGPWVEGTAYDLSVMDGSEPGVGTSVEPEDGRCWTKRCRPGACAKWEGWTKEGSEKEGGNEADTGCYHGMTNFKVVWCA